MTRIPADFDVWYRAHHPRLLTTLLVVLGDVDVASDATDAAFARAFEQWAKVSEMESPQGWVYRVAINVARRRWRRRRTEERLLRLHRTETEMPGPAGELWAVVQQLPERQRTAVVLRHVGHLSESEVATAMGIARGTVSATLRASYRELRLKIEDPDAEVLPSKPELPHA